MKEIDINNIKEIIENNNCAFLCGNGFSMNFDTSFRNIFDRLFEAHKQLIYDSNYNVYNKVNSKFKHKCIDNYKNVISYMRGFSEKKLYKVFDDGLKFAEDILNNKKLIEKIHEENVLTELVFGESELSVLEDMYCATNKESKNVNIEYWSILIYFYYLIEYIDVGYEFPKDNLFVSLIRIGNINKDKIIPIEDIRSKIINSLYFNGFNTYYRLLFSIAIFSNGKHLDFNKMDNMSKIDLGKIERFLNSFKSIITLNYDRILENIINNKVNHLHGSFILNKKEYVYNQSLGLKYDTNNYVSFSDILIGNYFYNKTSRAMLNDLSQKEMWNKKMLHHTKIISSIIKENKINVLVFFGMNIKNDQHILRTFMTEFGFNKIKNSQIIYCYFNKDEKNEFNETFHKVITFNEELSEYARNIGVSYIDTNKILKEYFLK